MFPDNVIQALVNKAETTQAMKVSYLDSLANVEQEITARRRSKRKLSDLMKRERILKTQIACLDTRISTINETKNLLISKAIMTSRPRKEPVIRRMRGALFRFFQSP